MTLIRPDNTKVHGVFIYCGFYALLYWKLISEVFITVELNKYHIIQLQETGVPLNMMSFNIKGNKVCHEDVELYCYIILC